MSEGNVVFELRGARYDAASSVCRAAPSTHMGLRRLAREALPHLHLLASGTLCLLLSTLAELMLSRTAGSLLDLLGSRDVATRMAEVDALFWQLAGYFAVIAVIKHLGEYFLKLAGERLAERGQSWRQVPPQHAISYGSGSGSRGNEVGQASRAGIAGLF